MKNIKSGIKILFIAQYGLSTAAHFKIFEKFSQDLRVNEIVVLVPKIAKVDKVYHPAGFIKGQKIVFENNKGKILPISFIFGGVNPISLFFQVVKFNPDVIFVLNEGFSKDTFWASFVNFVIKIFNPLYKKPKIYFYGFENINKYFTEYTWIQKIAAWFIKNTIHFGIVCTDEAVKILNEVGWYPKTKKIWWGVNIEDFMKEISKEKLRLIRETLRIPDDYFVIGYVGRFIEEKGIKDLVEAFLRLNIKAVLLLIGEGKERNWLEEKARENRNIIILPTQTHDNLALYYKLMDVLVLPSKTTSSWKEQYGRVLIEAMASGVKVVGSDSGSIPEIINGCGTIFKEGNVNDMKNAIEKELMIERDKSILLERAKLGSIENFVNKTLEFFLENL